MLGGALGVWIHFGLEAYNYTNDGLNALQVDAIRFDIPEPAVRAATRCNISVQ